MGTRPERAMKWLVVSCGVLLVMVLSAGTLFGPPRRVRPRVRRPVRTVNPTTRRNVAQSRHVRRRNYWHTRTTRPAVYTNLGYGYYVGGTSYVTQPTATTTVGTPLTGAVGDRYKQIQELVDMVHEWRSMNESSEVHKRLPTSDVPMETATTLRSIRTENGQFDKVSREAMRELAAGRSAKTQIASAQAHLDTLTKLLTSLPEVKTTAIQP